VNTGSRSEEEGKMQRFATIHTTTTYRINTGDLDDRSVEALVRAIGHDGLDERVEPVSDEDIDVIVYRRKVD